MQVSHDGAWDDFLDEWDEAEIDYNHIFRWDWKCIENGEYDKGELERGEKLIIYYILQRKAYNISCIYIIQV